VVHTLEGNLLRWLEDGWHFDVLFCILSRIVLLEYFVRQFYAIEINQFPLLRRKSIAYISYRTSGPRDQMVSGTTNGVRGELRTFA
jgi:hypothetical protein